MAKVITFGNFKGGVGKTTATCMMSYILNKRGYRVLTIDFDPQANATKFLDITFHLELDEFTSVYEAIKREDLSKAIVNLTDGFDLLPSGTDLLEFTDFVSEKMEGVEDENDGEYIKHLFLDLLLVDIKDNYDFIIIDIPPTYSTFSNNAIGASDFSLIIMQTEPDSWLGAIDYNSYVNDLKDKYKKNYDFKVRVLGILPYLQNKRSKIDEYILETSMSDNSKIRDLVFKNHIYTRERVKRFRVSGITNDDFHDKRVFKMYNIVVDEFLQRMEKMNNE